MLKGIRRWKQINVKLQHQDVDLFRKRDATMLLSLEFYKQEEEDEDALKGFRSTVANRKTMRQKRR